MSHRTPADPSALAALLAALLALSPAPAPAQDGPAPRPPGAQPGLQPVPGPGVLGGRPLPGQPPAPKGPPPVETIDDATVALVIDGERVDRAAYGAALIEEFGGSFLEPFVASWLIERRARQLGVSVTAGAVDAAAAEQRKEMVERRYKDEAQFRALLAQNGMTLESWLDGLKRRLRRDLLAKAIVRADRDVSDDALRREWEARYGPGGVQRRGRHILVSTQVWTSNLYTQADYEREKPELEADAKARAEAAWKELAAGKDFAALARERSDDHTAKDGGDLGRHWKNRYGSEADQKLAALKPGETSPPIATPRGFLVARATARKDGYEFRARHLLLSTQIAGQADAAFREKRLADARSEAARLRDEIVSGKRKFEEVAAERSDDRGTRPRGGDLGKFATGEMVPEFEAACLALEPGAVSEPVVTSFGVHLVQLIERTRRPERDEQHMAVILFSTEFLKVKERRLGGVIEARAAALAEEVAAKLRGGASADELARKHSDDAATREAGGLVEEPLKPGLDAEAAAAFRALKAPGEVAVVRGKQGIHILKLETLEETPFERVKADLAAALRDREPTVAEIREYRERLREKAKVQKGRMEGAPR